MSESKEEPKVDATPQFCDVKTAASILSISRQSVYDLLRRDKIPSCLIGKRRRIKIVDLDKWIAAQGGEYEPLPGFNKALREDGGAS